MKKKFYIQITAGRGPIECAAVVGRVHDIIKGDIMDLEEFYNIKTYVIDYNEHNESDRYGVYNCYMSITAEVEYDDDYVLKFFKKNWEGTVKWVATKNKFRPNHKRKNWYVGVKIYELPEPLHISESLIEYDTLRSSGPGGQNVNKVESAVRATYTPTGDSVVVRDTRDQFMNKILAKQRLIDKLTLINKYNMDVLKVDNWLEHANLERGGEIKTFKGEL